MYTTIHLWLCANGKVIFDWAKMMIGEYLIYYYEYGKTCNFPLDIFCSLLLYWVFCVCDTSNQTRNIFRFDSHSFGVNLSTLTELQLTEWLNFFGTRVQAISLPLLLPLPFQSLFCVHIIRHGAVLGRTKRLLQLVGIRAINFMQMQKQMLST